MISKTNKGNRYKYRWKSSGNTIKGWMIPLLETSAVQKPPKKVQIKNGRIYNTDTNTDKNENTGRYVKR